MATKSSSERRWVWLFAFAVIAITSIPYVIGFMNQGDGFEFTGFVFGVNDGNSYISKMLAGNHGDWLFRTPYTTFPQDGILVYLPYILLGKLVANPASHRELVLVFHLFRIAAVFMIVLATYDFVALFFKRITSRRIALFLITVGGGLGWLLVILGNDQWLGSLPLEYFSPESFGFLAIFGLPHLAVARALMLWGFVLLINSSYSQSPSTNRWDRPTQFPGLVTGLIWIAVAAIQPINLAVAGILLGLYLAAWKGVEYFEKRKPSEKNNMSWSRMARTTVVSGLVAAPVLIVLGIDLITDPFFREWGMQNVLNSPHFAHYILAYGVLLPLVVVGIVEGWRGRNRALFLLPSLWFVIFPILAYIPVSIQRRLPEGVWIAIVILAVLGFEFLAHLPKKRLKTFAYAAFALCLPAALFLVLGGSLTALNRTSAAYRPADEVRIFQHLADIGKEDALVLTAFDTGNALPAWAPMRVVIGHGPELIELELRNAEITSIYSDATEPSVRLEMIGELGVNFVFWGPEEKSLGTWDPNSSPNFHQVIQLGEYAVFGVNTD